MADQVIASFVEVLTALNLADSTVRTAQDEALARLVHGPAENAVKKYLFYNPVFSERTEFYPPADEMAGSLLHQDGEVTHARLNSLTNATTAHLMRHRHNDMEQETLCLRHIPIRVAGDSTLRELDGTAIAVGVPLVRVFIDFDARGGQAAGAFPASSEIVIGQDFYVDLDMVGVASDVGFLYCISRPWPMDIGCIKVVYGAGYTANEFMGHGDLDASAIKMAVLMTIVKFFKQLKLQGATAGGGFLPGSLTGEKLGDYSYTLSSATGSGSSDLSNFDFGQLPDGAKELLEPFQHYGQHCIL